MRLSEIKRTLLDHENRLRVLEGRVLVNKAYKAPLEKDVLMKEPIENPKPIKVEEPKIIVLNRDKEREVLAKKAEEEEKEAAIKILKEESETKMTGTPERKKEEGEEDVFPETNNNKEEKKEVKR